MTHKKNNGHDGSVKSRKTAYVAQIKDAVEMKEVVLSVRRGRAYSKYRMLQARYGRGAVTLVAPPFRAPVENRRRIMTAKQVELMLKRIKTREEALKRRPLLETVLQPHELWKLAI